MRKMISILFVGLCSSVLFAGPGDYVDFNDGGEHVIDYHLMYDIDNAGSARTDYGIANDPGTDLILIDGGRVEYEIYGYNNSNINVQGGEVWGNIIVLENARFEMSDGYVGSFRLYNDSYGIFSGGHAQYDQSVNDNASLLMTGGEIDMTLYCGGNSNVIVEDGSIGYYLLAYDDSRVTVHNCRIYRQLQSSNRSEVIVNGGHISGCITTEYGSLTITGGSVGGLTLSHDSNISLVGSLHYFDYTTGEYSTEPYYGSLANSVTSEFVDATLETYWHGRVRGTLSNGEQCELEYRINRQSSGWTCDITLLPSADTIEVTSPNGGELYVSGTEHDIMWSSHGSIENVLLEYSLDNGTAWTEIDSASNTGSYIWTVPYTTSTECLVRITDPNNPATNDVSDAVFEITPYTEVYFADSNLKAAVEAELGIQNPNTNDMLSLTYLDARSLHITDMTGLEYAENLSTAYLFSNEITNIEPISELPNLTYIHLAYNQIESLPDISSWTKIRYLYLYNNIISDITPLISPEITTLRNLYIYNNEVLPIEAYRDHIPTIKANNPNLVNFRYDYGCEPMLIGDVNKDCAFNLADLAILASDWSKCSHIYQELCQ